MAGRKLGKCGGCGTLVDVCSGCAQCIPRYICCNVEILEVAPYLELTACCETFGFRVPLLCDQNEDTGEWSRRYSGGGACPEGVGIDIDVNLMQDEYTQECFIRVNSTNLSFSQDYDGWDVGAAAIVFQGTDLLGNLLRVTIACAAMLENPLALPLCSPCSCLRCLPCRLCVGVVVPGRFFYDPDNDCQVTTDYIQAQYIAFTGDWNGNGWTFDPQTLSFPEDPDGEFTLSLTVEFLPLESGYCGIRIEASANYSSCFGSGSYLREIFVMDNGIDGRRWGGTECRSNEGIDEPVGTPQLHPCPDEFPDCPDPQPQRYVSFIDYDFYLEQDPYAQVALPVYVRIRDNSCGPCVMCQEPIPESCCPDLPDQLTASAVGSGGSDTVTLNRTGAATWTGSIPNFRADCTLEIELSCDPEREFPWQGVATLGGDSGASGYHADGGAAPAVDCDAFEVIVQILTTGSFCAMTIENIVITITA